MSIKDIVLRKNADTRTARSIKNIIFTFALKMISIATSLLIVPLTIGFLNTTRYGIWLAISSILGWFSYFDMGLTHGFRNRFAEAKARGDLKLAQEYVSTTYIAMLFIFTIFYLLFVFVNHWMSWAGLLNVPEAMENELKKVFSIVVFWFSFQMTLKPLSTMLIADQKPALSSLLDTLSQVVCLLLIILLSYLCEGSLVILAQTVSIVPVVTLFVSSLYFYNRSYKAYRPKIKSINLGRIKDIIFLGGEFFIIQISSIFVFQSLNVVLSHTQGPDSVTVFNISYKCFNTFNMIFAIVLVPFWSAFTEAYIKSDFAWMKNVYSKLSVFSSIMVCFIGVFLLISPTVYKLWIGDSVVIPMSVSVVMAIYISFTTMACVPVTLLNGVGAVRIQMYIHLFFAIITIPILLYLLENFELYIGLLFIVLNPLTHFVISSIQLNKILKNKAYGIWKK